MAVASGRLQQHVTHVARAMSPSVLSRKLQTRKLIQNFADEHGMVYFGYVNYRNDEHRLVRGMTTATGQEDTHYCIGTYDGYDVVFVRRRSESSKFVSGRPLSRQWLVMQIDLRTKFDVPHVFVGPHPGKDSQYDEITSALHSFQPIMLGVFGAHDRQFTNRYTVYTKSSRNIDTERLIHPGLTVQIGQHFWPLAFEIWDGCLFIYSSNRRPTAALLDVMLKNGVWLARQIDERCEELAAEQLRLGVGS